MVVVVVSCRAFFLPSTACVRRCVPHLDCVSYMLTTWKHGEGTYTGMFWECFFGSALTLYMDEHLKRNCGTAGATIVIIMIIVCQINKRRLVGANFVLSGCAVFHERK